jgi:hypothetical protein
LGAPGGKTAVMAPRSPLEPEQRPPEDDGRMPWHLWLLIVAAVVYLGWRLVQGIQALINWLAG